MRDFSKSLQAYAGGGELDWIDDTIGTDADAPYLFDATRAPGYDDMVLWQTEFWNRSLGTSVQLGPPVRDPLPAGLGTIDPVTGRIDTPGMRPRRTPSQRSGCRSPASSSPRRSLLTLYRVDQPLRLAGSVEGVYADGWMGPFAAYSHYGDAPDRRVTVTLSREAWGGRMFPGDVTVRVGTPDRLGCDRDARPGHRDEDRRPAPARAQGRLAAHARAAVPRRGHRHAHVLAVAVRRSRHAAARSRRRLLGPVRRFDATSRRRRPRRPPGSCCGGSRPGLDRRAHAERRRGVVAPQILCDEFIHAGIADSVVRNGEYAYRDAPLRLSFTYPLATGPCLAGGLDGHDLRADQGDQRRC